MRRERECVLLRDGPKGFWVLRLRALEAAFDDEIRLRPSPPRSTVLGSFGPLTWPARPCSPRRGPLVSHVSRAAGIMPAWTDESSGSSPSSAPPLLLCSTRRARRSAGRRRGAPRFSAGLVGGIFSRTAPDPASRMSPRDARRLALLSSLRDASSSKPTTPLVLLVCAFARDLRSARADLPPRRLPGRHPHTPAFPIPPSRTRQPPSQRPQSTCQPSTRPPEYLSTVQTRAKAPGLKGKIVQNRDTPPTVGPRRTGRKGGGARSSTADVEEGARDA